MVKHLDECLDHPRDRTLFDLAPGRIPPPRVSQFNNRSFRGLRCPRDWDRIEEALR